MPTIADMLPPDGVLLHLSARSMAGAVEQISALAAEVTGIRATIIEEALLARTRDGVGVGGGIAIPHARIPGLRRVTAFFARPLVPIPLDDGSTVHLIFVLLAPEGAHSAHLKALAQVAGLLRNPESRAALEVGDKSHVYAMLTAA